MNRLKLGSVLLSLAISGVAAQDLGQQVESLLKNGTSVEQAVALLFDRGFDLGHIAQQVSQAVSNCDDVLLTVAAAVSLNPESARAVVSAVSAMGSCNCDAEDVWARSRLEGRLRPPAPFGLVPITNVCSCGTMAVQAASVLVPDQYQQLIDAALRVHQPQVALVDSIGQIGENSWVRAISGVGTLEFTRNPTQCLGDQNGNDTFDPFAQWHAKLPNDKLGSHSTSDCDGHDLLISKFKFDAGSGSYVEVYNASNRPIDLSNRYLLSVHFDGRRKASQTFPLTGQLDMDETMILGSDDLSSEMSAMVDITLKGLSIERGDYVAIHGDVEEADCECAETFAGASTEGLETQDPREWGINLTGRSEMLCQAEVASFLVGLDGPVFFAVRPNTPTREPSPELPPNVDPIASPN